MEHFNESFKLPNKNNLKKSNITVQIVQLQIEEIQTSQFGQITN